MKYCIECGKRGGNIFNAKAIGISDPSYLLCNDCCTKKREYRCYICGEKFMGRFVFSRPKCPKCGKRNVTSVKLSDVTLKENQQEVLNPGNKNKIQFVYQLKQGPFSVGNKEVMSDLAQMLTKNSIRIERLTDNYLEFIGLALLDGWNCSIEVAEKGDILAFRVLASRNKGKAAIMGSGSLAAGAIAAPVCLPMGFCIACTGISAASDKEGSLMRAAVEKGLKDLCQKHGMTLLK